MSSLLFRRIIVWVVSMALGVLTTYLILQFFLPGVSPSPTPHAVSPQEYGIQYFFWTAFPLGLMFVTVFDYFLDTRILPD